MSGNLIPNCPITRANISNACKFLGPDLASIHGKTVQRMPAPVVADYVAIPWQLVDANKAVTLAADVFFMDGIAFLITVSRRIKFVTTEHLPVRTATSLSKNLQQVLLVYRRDGFRVRSILMDEEFEKVKGLMPTVECNTTTAKDTLARRNLHQDGEGADTRDCDNAAIHPHPAVHEDRVRVLHSTLAERFPSEDGNIKHIFAARDISTFAA